MTSEVIEDEFFYPKVNYFRNWFFVLNLILYQRQHYEDREKFFIK